MCVHDVNIVLYSTLYYYTVEQRFSSFCKNFNLTRKNSRTTFLSVNYTNNYCIHTNFRMTYFSQLHTNNSFFPITPIHLYSNISKLHCNFYVCTTPGLIWLLSIDLIEKMGKISNTFGVFFSLKSYAHVC